MWHILKKLSEKVGANLFSDEDFSKMFSSCVSSSDTPEQFDMQWKKIIDTNGLVGTSILQS